jgi:hypothetical protein
MGVSLAYASGWCFVPVYRVAAATRNEKQRG